MDAQCPKCGAGMDDGTTDSRAPNYYSDRQTGSTRAGMTAKRARACTGCGYLELYIDPAELRG